MDNQQAATLLDEIAELIDSPPKADAVNADAAYRGLEMHQEAQQLQRYAQTRRSGRFNWLIVGAFNNGKSSLINALLGTEAVLTGAVPTTAVVTRLSRGASLSITVHPREGDPYPISPATYQADYDLADHTDWADVDHLEISGDFEQLPPEVTLVDTPGLAENQLRTKLALEYLPHASAVIVVLDALRPLSRAERDFLALLGPGQLQNVFFALNRIDLLPPSELPKVQDWVKKRLSQHFSDEKGRCVDELYQQRVFFTNSADATDEQATGIVPLRQAVMAWQTQAEPSGGASEQQTLTLVSVLADVLHNARSRMAYQLNGLQQPLETLEAQVAQNAERLEKMTPASKAIQQRISQASNVIKRLIYSDLVQFGQTLESTWEEDVAQLDLEQLANTNIFSARFSDHDRTRMANALSHELQRYMQLKLIAWAKQLPQTLQASVSDLLEDIRHDLRSFQLELEEIAGLTGETLKNDSDDLPTANLPADRTVRRKAGLLQIDETLYSEIFNDEMLLQLIRPMTDQILTELPHNPKFKAIGLNVVQAVLGAGSFLVWQGQGAVKVLGALAHIGGALLGQLQRQQEIETMSGGDKNSQQIDETYAEMGPEKVETLQKAVRSSLTKNLRGPLFKQVHETLLNNREVIFQQVETELEAIGAAIGTQLSRAISEVATAQQQLVVTRRAQTDSLAHIQQQHEALERALRDRIDALCTATIARPLTDEEIEQLSENRAIFLPRQPYAPDPAPEVVAVSDMTEQLTEPSRNLPPVPTQAFSDRLLNIVKTSVGIDHVVTDADGNLSQISTDLARMVGLDAVKHRILDLMYYQADLQQRRQSGFNVSTPPSLHLVFTGNPGTGKTTVAEIVGKMYRRLGLLNSGRLISVSRADLVGAYIGHSEKKVRAIVEQACDGVLFVDEAYTLVKAESPNDFGMVALEELMRCMEKYRGRLAVIVAGYPAQMQDFLQANPGLMSRFPPDNVIRFPDYEPPDLQKILQRILAAEEYVLSAAAEAQIEQVIAGLYARRDKQFGNAREMRNLAQSLIRRRASRIQRTQGAVTDPICPEDINDYYQDFIRDSPQQADSAEAAMEKINQMIGLGSVKETLNRLMARVEINARLGEANRADTLHMLFRGAPGTGKTTVAEQFGKVLKGLGYLERGHLTVVSRGDLVGAYIGESEKKTRAVLDEALGGVLLIDEAYSLFIDESPQDFGRVVLDELTNYLDQYRDRLMVILAGYPDEIDALLSANPGLRDRFRNPIDFQSYSSNELMEICHKMAADEGYRFAPEAEKRIALYLERKRDADPDRFGNARAVRQLLDEMKGRLAMRISPKAKTITDDEAFRQLAKRLEAQDVPSLPRFSQRKVRRTTVMLDARGGIRRSGGREAFREGTRGRPSAKPLVLEIASPATDQCR